MAFSAFTHCLCLFYLLSSVNAANKASVGFENTSMTVPENIGQVTFCIIFNNTGSSANIIFVSVLTTNPNKEDPATSVGNFLRPSLRITVLHKRPCLNASVVDNSIIEFGKVYFLNITIFNALTKLVQYKENQRTLAITITDEDTVSIGFSKTSLTVSESDGNVTVCMNRLGEARDLGGGGVPLEAISVRLSTVQGTAASNDDFTPLNSYLVDFGLNETFKCIDVPLSNDKQTEYTETFYIAMKNGSSYVIVNETRNNLTVNIMNDDKVSIGFSKTSLTVSESDGNVTVCMNRQGEAMNPRGEVFSGTLGVRLSTVQGTAASNDDFTPLNSYLVDFGLNETFKCINVSLINDNKPEHMETFYITMTNGSSYVTVNETRNKLTVNIMNDDKATAQFEEEYREIEENAEEKVVELGCVINQTSQIPLRIGFETDNSSSTAIVEEDFTIVNKSLTFPPGEYRVSLQIKIIHDRLAESPEILVLRMISLDEDLVIIGENNTAKVKIIDKFDNEEAATQKQKQEQEQEQIEKEQRSKVYKLLIAAIVLMTVLIIGGIVVFVYFCIKLKQA